jgi:hypothetical protein
MNFYYLGKSRAVYNVCVEGQRHGAGSVELFWNLWKCHFLQPGYPPCKEFHVHQNSALCPRFVVDGCVSFCVGFVSVLFCFWCPARPRRGRRLRKKKRGGVCAPAPSRFVVRVPRLRSAALVILAARNKDSKRKKVQGGSLGPRPFLSQVGVPHKQGKCGSANLASKIKDSKRRNHAARRVPASGHAREQVWQHQYTIGRGFVPPPRPSGIGVPLFKEVRLCKPSLKDKG